MREIWIIALNVFRQLLRNRILVVLTLFALCLVGVSVFLSDLGQEAELRLGQDFGLLAIEWVAFFSVLLCHVVLLFEETELKTISLLLVKPVERWQYLGGKILGSILLMLMNQAAMVLVMAVLGLLFNTQIVTGPFVVAALYLSVGGALLSTVAALFSILASSVPAAAVFTTFTFALGHFTTNLLEWVQRLEAPLLKSVVKGLYWVLPNFSLFNLKENLTKVSFTLSGDVYTWPLLYAASYGGVMFLLAAWGYERKEF